VSSASHVDSLNKDQINYTLLYFSDTEWNRARAYILRNQYDLLRIIVNKLFLYTRMYEGEEKVKTDLLCRALSKFYELQSIQGNYDEALTFAEEAYCLQSGPP
jgi:hypothetical protein